VQWRLFQAQCRDLIQRGGFRLRQAAGKAWKNMTNYELCVCKCNIQASQSCFQLAFLTLGVCIFYLSLVSTKDVTMIKLMTKLVLVLLAMYFLLFQLHSVYFCICSNGSQHLLVLVILRFKHFYLLYFCNLFLRRNVGGAGMY
jgi:hypothetical protein